MGTTNSAVGVVDSGFPILLADEDGSRITPSAVWYGAGGEVEVGRKALRRRAAAPDRVATSIKRLIGLRYAEADRDFPLAVEPAADGGMRVLGKSPEEVSSEILRELKRIAEWRMGSPARKAVITVPAYFHDGQRTATKRAGEAAGLEVVRILNEPTAAAMAYGLDKLGERSRVAVYDWGGGTFDMSVLEMQDGVFQVLATHGNTRLGGDDVDMALARWAAASAGVDFVALDLLARVRLLAEAERIKCVLSDAEDAVFRAPFYDGANSLEARVTRDDFNTLAMPWINQTLRHCRQAMSDAKVAATALDAVVLVGGSTRIPCVRREIANALGRTPDISQHPDEAVALGAAIQAGVMSGSLRKMILLDVTPLSLGIETFGGLMNTLIPRNTTIPCKAGEMFTNAMDSQSAMSVRVLQGEREMARDNWELGCFTIDFAPAPKGRARVGVQFQIDTDGILEVLARDVATGHDTIMKLESAAVDVDDVAVEEMVSKSIEHAFEDMAERVFAEAKLKAEELLPAVEQALARGLANDAERMEIESAAAMVCQALAEGTANSLKAAVQQLDQATEALAARMVQEAMDRALDKRLGDP